MNILSDLEPAPSLSVDAAPVAPALPPVGAPEHVPVKRGRGRPKKSDAAPSKPAAPELRVEKTAPAKKSEKPSIDISAALSSAFLTGHSIAAKRHPAWAISKAEADALGSAVADVARAVYTGADIQLPPWAEPVAALVIVASAIYLPRIAAVRSDVKEPEQNAPAANG